VDVGLLDHGHQRLLGRPARLQKGREVTALAQLRDVQPDRAGPGIPLALSIAIRRNILATLENIGRAMGRAARPTCGC